MRTFRQSFLGLDRPMQKIPLKPLEETTPQTNPRYLVDALEVLLVGGIWLFVLVMLPVLQQLEARQSIVLLPEFAKAMGVVTLVLSLVVGVFNSRRRDEAEKSRLVKEWSLLLAMAVSGGLLVCIAVGLFSRIENVPYLLALQAILALAYFMARRTQAIAE